MTRQRAIVWIGLAMYAVSFVLVAVGGPDWMRGWTCAYLALSFPLSALRDPALHPNLLFFLPLLVSGWINVLFLVALILRASRRQAWALALLRVIILLMIPGCWLVFLETLRPPREGHFVWIIGMLLVLFSDELSQWLRLHRTIS